MCPVWFSFHKKIHLERVHLHFLYFPAKSQQTWKFNFCSTLSRQLLLGVEAHWKLFQTVANEETLCCKIHWFHFLSFARRGKSFQWLAAADKFQQISWFWNSIFRFHHLRSTSEGVVEGQLLFGRSFWVTFRFPHFTTFTFLRLLVTFAFWYLQVCLAQRFADQLLISICIVGELFNFSWVANPGWMYFLSKVDRCSWTCPRVKRRGLGWGEVGRGEEGWGSIKRWGEGGGRRGRGEGGKGRWQRGKGGRRILGPELVARGVEKAPILLKINRMLARKCILLLKKMYLKYRVLCNHLYGLNREMWALWVHTIYVPGRGK